MDALTIAFTKRSHIQYLNNLNSKAIKLEAFMELSRKSCIATIKEAEIQAAYAFSDFRAEAKKHLENTLISIKAKNKVTTININTTNKKGGTNKKKQLTQEGSSIWKRLWSKLQPLIKEEKVGGNFNEATIAK
jgi:CRISPR-associated endonuclease Csn1